MPEQRKKYAVMYIPHSGLFFSHGSFIDGQTRSVWPNRMIPVYRSYNTAVVVRDEMKAECPDWDGDFVVISLEFLEQD